MVTSVNRRMPSGKKGERTRARIKAAARRCLGERDFHALRVEDVTREAGLSTGTFYIYFDNKRDLVFEIAGDVLADSLAEMHSAGQSDDPYTAIYETNLTYLRQFEKHAKLGPALLRLAAVDPQLRAVWQQANQASVLRIAREIERRSPSSPVEAATRELVSHALAAMVDGIAQQYFVHADPGLRSVVTDMERLATLLSVLWYRAVYCADPPDGSVRHPEVAALRLDSAQKRR